MNEVIAHVHIEGIFRQGELFEGVKSWTRLPY